MKSGGIITEQGNILSHAAIVAHSLVYGCKNVLKQIKIKNIT
jgi:phosphohistidine swiveling domain-containing protein